MHNQKFITHLLGCLKNKEYVLFEHFAVHKPIQEIPINILLPENEHQMMIENILSFSAIGVSNCVNKNTGTEVYITFQDGVKTQLNIWFQLTKENVNFLNPQEIFARRQHSKSEFFMPNIEHLFEFSVLFHFLNGKGLPSQYQEYFEDFHFFVKDGLLDFFNDKYQTAFINLDELSNFQNIAKENIVGELNKFPDNHFFKKINLQWLNFWGTSVG